MNGIYSTYIILGLAGCPGGLAWSAAAALRYVPGVWYRPDFRAGVGLAGGRLPGRPVWALRVVPAFSFRLLLGLMDSHD